MITSVTQVTVVTLGCHRDVEAENINAAASVVLLDPATVNSLPAQIKHDVFFAISHAVQSVFIWALPAAVLIFVLALFLKEVPLRGRIAPPEAGETASQQPELVS